MSVKFQLKFLLQTVNNIVATSKLLPPLRPMLYPCLIVKNSVKEVCISFALLSQPKRYDWIIHKNLFTQKKQLQNIILFSTIHHRQTESQMEQRIFLHVIPIRIRANIYLFRVCYWNTGKKVWNIFKVNNKDVKTTSMTSLRCLCC